MKNKIYVLFVVIVGFLPSLVFGFTFTSTEVTIVNGTCANNGRLTFNPTGLVAGSTMNYLIYKLPNTTTPYASQTTNTIGSLTAANYRIIATENVAGIVSAPQQVDVTISTTFVPLTYSVTDLNSGCVTTTTTITLNVLTGTGSFYGILSGPMTAPYQRSNIFNNLVPGSYNFSVIDNCGNALTKTYTIVLNPPSLNIAPPIFSDSVPANCTTINVSNLVTPSAGSILQYPLNIRYTINPPTGPAIIINNVLPTGSLTSQNITQSIPFYPNTSYSYDIQITDNCGKVHPQRNFVVTDNLSISQIKRTGNCGIVYFQLQIAGFTPPYTLNFTAAPPAFNLNTANASYPNYNPSIPTDAVDFGNTTTTMPIGNYVVTVTDFCGSTKTLSFNFTNPPIRPAGVGTNNGCLSTTGNIILNAGDPLRKLVFAEITATTATAYPNALPHNVTPLIDATGILNLNNIPLGTYTFTVTDDCGVTTTLVIVNIAPYTNKGANVFVRPGCSAGRASIAVQSNNGNLTSVKIISGPTTGFPYSYPYNAVANILTNKTLMLLDNIPNGNYTIEVIDDCGFTTLLNNYAVAGYSQTTQSLSFVNGCSVFDIPINYTSNAVAETFWLQKEISTGVWGHPATGAIYTNGSLPNTTNSDALANSLTANVNFQYNGTFRVVRAFLTYNNGSEVNAATVTSRDKNCIEILSPTHTFNDVLGLVSINKMPCTTSGNADIVILATGAAPLQYKIVDNAIPANVIIDNGTSNIFYGLPTGTYNFQITDACLTSQTFSKDTSTLASIVTINPLFTADPDIVLCATTITSNERFDLTVQTPKIINATDLAKYTISYFQVRTNAQTNTIDIPNPSSFDPPTNNFTVYARVVFNQLPSCYEIVTFKLIVGQTPVINLNPTYQECVTGQVVLNASAGNLSTTTYNWSTGATTPSITINTVGVSNISVTATNMYGTVPCTSPPKNIKVTISEPPKIKNIDIVDWTENQNSITINTSTTGNYEYSIDGVNFQNSNVFSNLPPGVYTVKINDINNCGNDTKVVWLLFYPRFFTPNNDGINDYWNIPNARLEKSMQIVIYDRYGKIVNSFNSYNTGWDGTYNGNQLPSDDYWFVITRQDGRIHKGHFTMKR